MPKVTVILTSYNHAKYIRETIDSILNQTFKDFQLIIWDDASTDHSWEIIQSYDDSRIKKFQSERTEGGLINKALMSEEVHGEYVAIHHSDDVWELTKLEKQVKFLDENSQYGAVFTNAQAINEDSELFEDINHFYHSIFEQPNRTRYEWLNFFFYKGNALCHPSVMIRKECYDNCGLYRYGLAQLGDFDMWIRLCMKYEIYVLPEKLTKFRVRDNEANSSGGTPINRIRGMNEHFFISQLFLEIKEIEDVVKIFPDAFKYIINDEYIIEFIIAMMQIKEKTWKDVNLLGINQLYQLINDNNKSVKIKKLYNFDYSELIKISAKYDLFNVENFNNYSIQLFIYQNEDFTEENSIKYPVLQTTELQRFEFDLKDFGNIKNLRFDPLNDSCVVNISQLYLVLEDDLQMDLKANIQANVCSHHGDSYFFEFFDPNIYFEDVVFESLSIKKFVVELVYNHFAKDAMYICANQMVIDKNHIIETKEQNIQTLNVELETKEQELSQAKQELENIKTELANIYISKSWKLTRPLRRFMRIVKK